MIAAPSAARDREGLWPLLLCAAAVLAFTLWRVPYDDEWCSIGLVFERDPRRLWSTLAGDRAILALLSTREVRA